MHFLRLVAAVQQRRSGAPVKSGWDASPLRELELPIPVSFGIPNGQQTCINDERSSQKSFTNISQRRNKRKKLKLPIIALLLFGVLTSVWAATIPLAGEYTGEWWGRADPGFGVQTQAVHLHISTNGEVLLFKTRVNPITGTLYTSTFYGTVQRNGIIRGGDNSGKFRAVPRENGQALRGAWFYPTRYGPVARVRFYASYD